MTRPSLQPSRTALLPILVASLLMAACDRSADPKSVDTIDVRPAIEISPDDDPRAVDPGPQLAGALPRDFPADLPIYLPASLDRYSTAGTRSVTLLTPHRVGRVRHTLEALYRERGWNPAADGDGFALSKNGRRALVHLENAEPGTRYIIEY